VTRLRPGTLRGRVTIGAVAAVALALAVLVVAFNLLLASSLRGDVDSRLRSRAAAATTTVSTREDRLVTSEGPGDAALDGGVWVFEGTNAIERPRASPALMRAAAGLAPGGERYMNTGGDAFRLYARPFAADGRRLGTVVVATSLAAYDRTTSLALIGSLLLALAILAAVLAVTWVAVGGALRPMQAMTDQAADWGDHDLGRRFGSAERPDELQRLAATFDGLLDRVAASLRHEQRLSAELSHELRTPLARIAAQAELLGRRPHTSAEQREAAELMHRSAERMTAILDTLMAAARAEAGTTAGVCDAGDAARHAAETVSGAAVGRGLTVSVACPARVRAGVDPQVTERVLAPLLENATRFARSQITVAVARDGGDVHIDVCDDGAGIAADRLETVFDPGVSFGAANGSAHDGAGLGLPLARRLARAAGGNVEALASSGGGHLRVTLPAG